MSEVKGENATHSLSTGLFGISEDFSENSQSLDAYFIGDKATSIFFFRATGDSMSPLLESGEVLLVDRSIEEFHGRVCIMAFEGELICKRVLKTQRGLLLKSENPKFKDILVKSSESVELWGVVSSHHGLVL